MLVPLWLFWVWALALALVASATLLLAATESSVGDWLAVLRGQRTRPTFSRLEELERQDAHAREHWPKDVDALTNARRRIDELRAELAGDFGSGLASAQEHESQDARVQAEGKAAATELRRAVCVLSNIHTNAHRCECLILGTTLKRATMGALVELDRGLSLANRIAEGSVQR